MAVPLPPGLSAAVPLMAGRPRANRPASGAMKAIWLIFLIFLPFLGALIYIAMRPKVTAQDLEMATQADAASKAAAGVSVADQLEKLAKLRDAGTISVPEYEALKAKLLA